MGAQTTAKIEEMNKALDTFETGFKKAVAMMEKDDGVAAYLQMGSARGAVVKASGNEAKRLELQGKQAKMKYGKSFDDLRKPLDARLTSLKSFKQEKERRALEKIVKQKESFKKIDEYIEQIELSIKKCAEAVGKFTAQSFDAAKINREMASLLAPAQKAASSADAASKDTDD
jgi:hypothetical protein